jgi:hypothetical protein
MEIQYKLGFIPSKPDHRDYIYGKVVGLNEDKVSALPSSFAHDRMPENLIYTQVIGDCTGQSSRYIKILQEYRSSGVWYDLNGDFVYAIAKTLDGIPNEEGSYPKVTQQVLNQYGICHRGKYIDLNSNSNRPAVSQDAYNDAKPFVTKSYAKIQTLDEIKHALVEQGAVQLAIIIFESFVNCEAGGFIPTPMGTILGGHAICCDAYFDDMVHTYSDGKTYKGFLRVINSWGVNWGDRGYAYIPYDLLNYRTDIGITFFSEAWSSCDVSNSPIPTPQPQPQAPTQANTIELYIDSKTAYVDSHQVTLDVSPKIENNLTLVPLRFVGENMGYDVSWDGSLRKVTLKRK